MGASYAWPASLFLPCGDIVTGMAHPEKTLSDSELLLVIAGAIEHLTIDGHHLERRLAAIEDRLTALETKAGRADAMLTEFEPIIRLYASPVSAYTAARRGRRARREVIADAAH
jgi:hypothetical protein